MHDARISTRFSVPSAPEQDASFNSLYQYYAVLPILAGWVASAA
ncbi:hypothetical protein NIES2104_27030 [Leptolyngbya sp. NIES-2104]|nr:hypothetical protein NIES2104_27030 [Leptolyngbya sp. NIES-2104]